MGIFRSIFIHLGKWWYTAGFQSSVSVCVIRYLKLFSEIVSHVVSV